MYPEPVRAEGGRQQQPHVQGYQGSSRLVTIRERVDSVGLASNPAPAAALGPARDTQLQPGRQGPWRTPCRLVSAGPLRGVAAPLMETSIPLRTQRPGMVRYKRDASGYWLGGLGVFRDVLADVGWRCSCKLTVSSEVRANEQAGFTVCRLSGRCESDLPAPWRPRVFSGGTCRRFRWWMESQDDFQVAGTELGSKLGADGCLLEKTRPFMAGDVRLCNSTPAELNGFNRAPGIRVVSTARGTSYGVSDRPVQAQWEKPRRQNLQKECRRSTRAVGGQCGWCCPPGTVLRVHPHGVVLEVSVRHCKRHGQILPG
jgi:hypothetical protein